MKFNERGLTLVEVIASIVIIAIVLLSMAQLVIQSNKTTAINNEKLVVIDLAEAVLERLKAESHVVKQTIESAPDPDAEIEIPLDSINFSNLTKKKINGKDHYFIEMNNETYQVIAYAKKCESEISDLGLRPVIVKVKRVERITNGTTVIKELIGKSEIEGYVEL
ncbi:MAG: prepilin-type N-terminal cleavage/methylation domain-containing protein [Lysinibacillus sp.]|nr:prepilin-type N-terminal cleavage/methylation domain-containing protein [Lysinibacillus sp.]